MMNEEIVMTEDQIAIVVKRELNIIAQAYMDGKISSEQFDKEIDDLQAWVDEKLATVH